MGVLSATEERCLVSWICDMPLRRTLSLAGDAFEASVMWCCVVMIPSEGNSCVEYGPYCVVLLCCVPF